MDIIHGDFESRGVVDLRGKESVGLYNYMNHRQTDLAMYAYSLNDQKLSLWEILKGEPMPKLLKEAVADPQVKFAAWNSQFERYGFKYKLNINIPAARRGRCGGCRRRHG